MTKLFDGVVAHVAAEGIRGAERARVADLLAEHGCEVLRELPPEPHKDTIVVTAMHQPHLAPGLRQVTPLWVRQVVRLGKFLGPEFYSPDPNMFFSGVVVFCDEQIPLGDVEVLYGGVEAFGGQWRTQAGPDVTHVVVLQDRTEEYADLVSAGHAKLILPHYFDDCFLFRRRCPDDAYLFPNPRLLSLNLDDAAPVRRADGSVRSSTPDSYDRVAQEPEFVLSGQTVFFDPTLGSSVNMRQLRQDAKTAGARVADKFTPEDVSVVVMDVRDATVFPQAYGSGGITIGTMRWLRKVLVDKAWRDPLSGPLFFPHPPSPIAELADHSVSVTQYVGAAREDIATMCQHMGLKFTRELSQKNTHLICARKTGAKYLKSREWGLRIVNHLWIEDMYVAWSCKAETDLKYVRDSPSLGDMVNTTQYDPDVLQNALANSADTEQQAAKPFSSGNLSAVRAQHRPMSAPSRPGGAAGLAVSDSFALGLERQQQRREEHDDDDAEPGESLFVDWISPPKGANHRQPPPAPIASSSMFAAPLAAHADPSPSAQGASNAGRTPRSFTAPKPVASRTPSTSRQIPARGAATTPRAPSSASTASQANSAGRRNEPGTLQRKRAAEATTPTAAAGSFYSQRGAQSEPKRAKTGSRMPPIELVYVTTLIESSERYNNPMRHLGAKAAEKDEDFDVLVSNTLARTLKFMLAATGGKPVVTEEWLKACVREDRLVELDGYELQDEANENKFGIVLRTTLARARRRRLLEGRTVFCVEGAITLSAGDLERVVTAAGGDLVLLPPGDAEHGSTRAGLRRDGWTLMAEMCGSEDAAETMIVLDKDDAVAAHGVPVPPTVCMTSTSFVAALLRQELPHQ
ncbi:regulator of Ty1 Transposition [Polyrhizophydium stewartii]|uniref:Regulator of Ty1 Transposition n=1 Tax=Polyrhizophydium stewartii TaxID=2732419 RepID=A0ABR4NCB3_9FUNG